MDHVVLKYEVDEISTVRDILMNKLKISSRLLRKLKLNKRIFCNKQEVWVNEEVNMGDLIEVDITFEENNEKIIPQEFKLEILYEDASLLVINKPAGIVVHPTCIHIDGTMANFVKYYLNKKGEYLTTRFVNRLDRETSGVIVFAKNEYVQECLVRQMQSKEFEKEYVAIVHGIIEENSWTIDFPIKREEGSIMTRVVSDDGEYAVTHYEVIKRLADMSVLRIRLETGRTHQIRVHMKAIGHPIVGDGLYSNIETDAISRQALHAYRLRIVHPVCNEVVEFLADIPLDMKKLIESDS